MLQDGKEIEDSKELLSGTMKEKIVLEDFLNVVRMLKEIRKSKYWYLIMKVKETSLNNFKAPWPLSMMHLLRG